MLALGSLAPENCHLIRHCLGVPEGLRSRGLVAWTAAPYGLLGLWDDGVDDLGCVALFDGPVFVQRGLESFLGCDALLLVFFLQLAVYLRPRARVPGLDGFQFLGSAGDVSFDHCVPDFCVFASDLG